MKLLIADVLSRIRTQAKINKDSLLTDRDLYAILIKHTSAVFRELDKQNKLMGFNSVFESLDYIPTIEVDRVEACPGLKTGYTFKRTKDPLPIFLEGYWGPMIRSVSSLDGTEECSLITLGKYQVIANTPQYKYNKTKYCWYLNDHLYFSPNVSWDAFRVEAICEGDISKYKKDYDCYCLPKQQQSFNVPDFILVNIEKMVLQELGVLPQLPSDIENDNKSPNK